jgi:hypothetical protein
MAPFDLAEASAVECHEIAVIGTVTGVAETVEKERSAAGLIGHPLQCLFLRPVRDLRKKT